MINYALVFAKQQRLNDILQKFSDYCECCHEDTQDLTLKKHNREISKEDSGGWGRGSIYHSTLMKHEGIELNIPEDSLFHLLVLLDSSCHKNKHFLQLQLIYTCRI